MHCSPVRPVGVNVDLFRLILCTLLENQRQWSGPPIEPEAVRLFSSRCLGEIDHSNETLGDGKGFDPNLIVLPHGSYLCNLANPDRIKWLKSFDCFIDELKVSQMQV